jgi:hypothetical protein
VIECLSLLFMNCGHIWVSLIWFGCMSKNVPSMVFRVKGTSLFPTENVSYLYESSEYIYIVPTSLMSDSYLAFLSLLKQLNQYNSP